MISGKWVPKRLGDVTSNARYVLRGFEEEVKTEDVFASTTLTASVRLLLSFAMDRKSEGYTVFTADDGDGVYARPLPEWSPETLDGKVGTVVFFFGEDDRCFVQEGDCVLD